MDQSEDSQVGSQQPLWIPAPGLGEQLPAFVPEKPGRPRPIGQLPLRHHARHLGHIEWNSQLPLSGIQSGALRLSAPGPPLLHRERDGLR